ncbi:facilitated trehalose transporter Tret1-2 homolog [Manduca sexta]|uniref:Major facilitator superfamily (MFS) profile domain-containing protein n=1 Tax=Manduca sexta TaxID=7130 RepID=A0A922CH52_MANSE|nr:facilitated trehalose transporter Tret1-2 homolog [Manduca sexta]XP_030021802.1 facilitated trehalose transporter Tret1-2 homolog [Manduca sexta]XP_037295208.1 facilitated trehalose transporter Tret1-2 homolog [Manduca sexta]KAG6446645.1 hypothetical protein O3G_MSEX004531 [Manduca sexta]KAG6446646.1 hypothetical protein O3G_MSEX004531 [Manduca sexta]KAG6446647.1 hypothetical protein O3G_MSEX004531 [Manduca sexta]KAG6446648.1 hypothetical protein O3G_MSEX004531 [Manduca sexta]
MAPKSSENNAEDIEKEGNSISTENTDVSIDNEESKHNTDTRTEYREKSDEPVTETNNNNGEVKSNYLGNIKINPNGLTLDGKTPVKVESLLANSQTVVRFSPVWKQSLAASAPILLTFAAGLTSGYSAILLPQLKNEHGPIPADESTTSWIASIAALPMAPGCLLSGWLLERFGRKTAHYVICVPFLLGWILIAIANNLTLMLFGRFFTGLCVGLLGPLGPVYIGETSEPKYRGFLLAGISLALAIGIMFAHVVGTFISWQWTSAICSLFPVLSAILLIFVPESPTWLISRGRVEDGIKDFYWLRGYSDEAKAELKGIIDSRIAADAKPPPTWKEKLTNLRSPELLKPLFIMIVFFVTCQFAGVNAIAFYSIEIVEKAVGEGIDHYLAMLIIDSLRLVMSVVACVVCKQYGRRLLCIVSGIATALSMIGLSMFLYWKPPDMSWLPLTCLMVYICAVSIGLVPLPWMMCGELFPTRVRGLGSGISSATTFVAFFIVVKTAPGMMTNFGEVITFLFYGVVAFVGTVVLYFILPETRGKSLQEIEEKFRSKKDCDPQV